jgi:xylulokinase
MMDYLLGVDLGTQGSKAVLCDVSGHVIAYAYHEHAISSPKPGWAEQDARRVWWGEFVTLVTEILNQSAIRPAQIACVAISSFIPALLLVDSAGNPIRPAIIYTDRRAQTELDEMKSLFARQGYTEEQTGPYWLASPIPQLMWLKKHEPEAVKQTAHILQCFSYIIYRLTNQTVADHAMKVNYCPLYDREKDGWSKERAALLGIDPDILPEKIGWSTEIAGTITPQAAQECGLAAGTRVTIGTGDSFAEMVGAGLVVPGSAAMIYGSFMPLLIIQDKTVSLWEGYHCLPGLYFDGVHVRTGAALTRWFRDQFGALESLMEREIGENAYQILDRQAARVTPGCDGLIALPDFSGDVGNLHPGLGRGSLLGLTTSHTRAHIYRALLEGTGYELRFQLESLGIHLSQINAVGGGVKGRVWTQIICDILNITQNVMDIPYGAPFGNAYLAGMAAGIFTDTNTLTEKWLRRVATTVRPDISTQAAYQKNFEIYKAVRAVLF